MANLSATIAALNSMLASQERRLQTDVQASLAAMDLGLKERQRKDLKSFRDRTLADREKQTSIMEKRQRDERRTMRANEFHKNAEEIQNVITMEKIEFANDIWSTMFSATYDKIVGGTTKLEDKHYTNMYKYLSGDNVGFKQEDARRIGRAILSYGSWTGEQGGKPASVMIDIARYMGGRMADDTTKAGFSFAAYNAGMAPDPRDVSKSGLMNSHNNLVFYGKAKELDAMQKDLDKEIEELSFVSSKPTEAERYEEENLIKYDWDRAKTQKRLDYVRNDEKEKNDPGKGSSVIAPTLKNITTQSYTPMTQVDKAKKELDKMIEMREAGDYSYRTTQPFLDLNPYFQGTYDASGQITGVNVQRMTGAKFDQPAGAWDYDMKTDERLQMTEDEQYEFQENVMTDLGDQVKDARDTIMKMNKDMALVTENAAREGVTTLPQNFHAMEITRFREEERLAYLEQQQMQLYEQVANRTLEGKDEWWFGRNERELREMLPGKYLTESERKSRKHQIQSKRFNTGLPIPYSRAKGINQHGTAAGGSLYDYLGTEPYKVPEKTEDVGKNQSNVYDPNSFGNTMKRGFENMGQGLLTTMDLLSFKPPYKG